MARQTTWVLALLMSCAPAAAAGVDAGQQSRPSGAQTPAARDAKDKDSKDRQPNGAKPEERERWKWWLYDRAELSISDQRSEERRVGGECRARWARAGGGRRGAR